MVVPRCALASQRLPEVLADKRAAWFLSAFLSSSDMPGMFWLRRSSAVRSSAVLAKGSTWAGSVGISPWFAASQADTGRLTKLMGTNCSPSQNDRSGAGSYLSISHCMALSSPRDLVRSL